MSKKVNEFLGFFKRDFLFNLPKSLSFKNIVDKCKRLEVSRWETNTNISRWRHLALNIQVLSEWK